MNNIVIMADSGCDLDEELQKRYGITVLLGHITLPDGSERLSTFNWEDFSGRETFYSELKKNPDGYKTSPPNVSEFECAFEKCILSGQAVICLSLSGGISGTFDFACSARNNILKKYPNARIECVDSGRFGPGFGLMTVHAAVLRNEGKSFEEITAYLAENKNRYHQAGWLDDLSFVAKKGRLTHAKAFFGTLAGVKPIGEFDYNGLTTVIGKVKGAKKAYAVLLRYIEKTIENPEEQIIYIAQSNRLSFAEEYKKQIEEKFHPKEVIIRDVYPTCGINVGPGLMAAYYVGKPISQGLTDERKILEEICSEESI
mgnify:CR=1 FL=1